MAQKKSKNVLDQVLGDDWDPDAAAEKKEQEADTAGKETAAQSDEEKTAQDSGTDAGASAAGTGGVENADSGEAQERSESAEDTEKDTDKKLESVTAAEKQRAVQSETLPQARYRITCKTPVNKEIAGILFVRGIGYTQDAFTASWFEGKGYTVTKVME
ncbi:MAG: hypothetical protein HDR21_12135 [Lachnospiraceae bacterium]|nr:hypothetical protein [Lachnospiraceae bacterium]